jgi:colanic acid biosynthesis glycosyl transferase WcaI
VSSDLDPTSVVIDDFAGHSFTYDLAAELARSGRRVVYRYCPDNVAPRGDMPPVPGLILAPVSLGRAFDKYRLVRRVGGELRYGWRSSRGPGSVGATVIAANMPLLSAAVLLAAARVRRRCFVLWWQDRQAALAQLSGAPSAVHRALALLEAVLVRRSDGVIAISPEMGEAARAIGAPPERVLVQPNWGTLDRIGLRPKANEWARRHSLVDRFVFMYSGTLARKHDPTLLVALADRLAGHPTAMVVVCCSGEGSALLDEAAATRANLLVLPVQSGADFPSALASADVLTALLHDGAAAHSVPSKILSYLCAGRPILLASSAANYAAQTVLGAGAGWVVPADPNTLGAAAEEIIGACGDLSVKGSCARRYAEETFDLAVISRSIVDFLGSLPPRR